MRRNSVTLNPLLRFLFPAPMRVLPHRRLWLGIFRALHIVCFSLLLGAVVFGGGAAAGQMWLVATVLSGLALFSIDVYASCIVLVQVRGVAVVIKILATAVLPWVEQGPEIWLLIVIIVASSLASHAPRFVRHRSLLPEHWNALLDPDVQIRPGGSR